MTKCPDIILDILLDILEEGITMTRFAAENEDHIRARSESNHIHNLPNVIRAFSVDHLRFYIDIDFAEYKRDIEGPIRSGLQKNIDNLNSWINKNTFEDQ